MAEHAMEAHVISFFQKIRVSALCWKAFVFGFLGLPRAYPWTLYGERCHSNKCQLLQHVKKWTEAGYPFKTERKVDTGCSAVTWQCTPSYSTPHHQHHSATEMGSSRAPCLQPRPGPFRFPSVWIPQECSKMSSICSWWRGERGGTWLASQSTTNLLFQQH